GLRHHAADHTGAGAGGVGGGLLPGAGPQAAATLPPVEARPGLTRPDSYGDKRLHPATPTGCSRFPRSPLPHAAATLRRLATSPPRRPAPPNTARVPARAPRGRRERRGRRGGHARSATARRAFRDAPRASRPTPRATREPGSGTPAAEATRGSEY